MEQESAQKNSTIEVDSFWLEQVANSDRDSGKLVEELG